MNHRTLGKTGYSIGEVGFGAWAIGGTWGSVDDEESMRALHAALERGVDFFDTADVYGDGRSERLIARLRREREERSRRHQGRSAAGPARRRRLHDANLEAFVDRSLRNLEVDALDLVQLHCPPSEVYYLPETFDVLDDLRWGGQDPPLRRERREGRGGAQGDRVPERRDGPDHLQRVPPAPGRAVLRQAKAKNVGVIARVPLASGLLTGKLTPRTTFESDDHRAFNRDGAAFDNGETFSGVDYDAGLAAVEALRTHVPEGMSLVQFALRWILSTTR